MLTLDPPEIAAEEEEFELLPHQYDSIYAPEPWKCLCTGVGGGKTTAGALWIIGRAQDAPQSIHLATANTHRQLEDVVVRALAKAADLLGLPHRYHQVKQVFYIDLGDCEAEIWCRQLQNPDEALRGIECGSWWGDEVRDYSKKAIDVVIGRLRCSKVKIREVFWTTTPNGFDAIYTMFVENAKDGVHRLITASTDANYFNPPDFVETLNRSYDEFMIQQERHGKFLNLSGGNLYYSFDRAVHVKKDDALFWHPTEPLYLCWDQNGSPLTCVVVQEIGRETWALDEVVLKKGNIPLACKILGERYGKQQAEIVLCGDAMGQTKSAQTGESDYQMMREALAKWYKGRIVEDVAQSNPPIVDRVNAVNYRLKDASGDISLFLHARCKELRLDFEQVRPLEGRREPDKKKDHDRTHASDAIGYLIQRRHPVIKFRREHDSMGAVRW